MKKLTVTILCLLLIAVLAGCGGSSSAAPEATAAPAATSAPAVTEAPAATEAPAVTAEPVVEGSDDVAETVAAILAMEGQPVEDLYDLVGQPIREAEYTPSCLVTGGQDGQLEYDGFTVYTLVMPDGTETIYYCE